MNKITIEFEEFDMSKNVECPKPITLVRATANLGDKIIGCEYLVSHLYEQPPLVNRIRILKEECARRLIQDFLSNH